MEDTFGLESLEIESTSGYDWYRLSDSEHDCLVSEEADQVFIEIKRVCSPAMFRAINTLRGRSLVIALLNKELTEQRVSAIVRSLVLPHEKDLERLYNLPVKRSLIPYDGGFIDDQSESVASEIDSGYITSENNVVRKDFSQLGNKDFVGMDKPLLCSVRSDNDWLELAIKTFCPALGTSLEACVQGVIDVSSLLAIYKTVVLPNLNLDEIPGISHVQPLVLVQLTHIAKILQSYGVDTNAHKWPNSQRYLLKVKLRGEQRCVDASGYCDLACTLGNPFGEAAFPTQHDRYNRALKNVVKESCELESAEKKFGTDHEETKQVRALFDAAEQYLDTVQKGLISCLARQVRMLYEAKIPSFAHEDGNRPLNALTSRARNQLFAQLIALQLAQLEGDKLPPVAGVLLDGAGAIIAVLRENSARNPHRHEFFLFDRAETLRNYALQLILSMCALPAELSSYCSAWAAEQKSAKVGDTTPAAANAHGAPAQANSGTLQGTTSTPSGKGTASGGGRNKQRGQEEEPDNGAQCELDISDLSGSEDWRYSPYLEGVSRYLAEPADDGVQWVELEDDDTWKNSGGLCLNMDVRK